MTRLLASCLLLLSLATGCAMCNNCDDYNFAAQGGMHPRMNMSSGRVNSTFDPADGEVISQGMPAEAAPESPPDSAPPKPQPESPPTTTYRSRWQR